MTEKFLAIHLARHVESMAALACVVERAHAGNLFVATVVSTEDAASMITAVNNKAFSVWAA